MSIDIVERLRKMASIETSALYSQRKSLSEAADEIVRLRSLANQHHQGDDVGALPGVEGFGASYNREEERWVIYTMPGVKPFGTVDGYNKGRLDWVIETLRSALAQHPLSVQEPVAWRYKRTEWGEEFWHSLTREPRTKEEGEGWEPLYNAPTVGGKE